MKEHILHINSYFVDTHLYTMIYNKRQKDYRQTVYIPIKQNRQEDNKMPITDTELVFSKLIRKHHTIFHTAKIDKLSEDLQKRQLHKGVDIVHAHNLYTDGAIALDLKRKFGLKYVVSVRMTDISMQYKYMWHRRSLGRKILSEAEHIIFISPLYQDRLYEMMDEHFAKSISTKTSILPNGIDDFWLSSACPPLRYESGDVFKLIYIGQLIKRKNLHVILEAVKSLQMSGDSCHLTIIGGENLDESEYFKDLMSKISEMDNVEYKGVIRDQSLLKNELANSHALVMPSKNELFGLVFIESISQNTPVLYPGNEGITPYLDNCNVGVEVQAGDSESIGTGIRTLMKNYEKYTDISDFAKKFDWNTITNKFSQLYMKLR